MEFRIIAEKMYLFSEQVTIIYVIRIYRPVACRLGVGAYSPPPPARWQGPLEALKESACSTRNIYIIATFERRPLLGASLEPDSSLARDYQDLGSTGGGVVLIYTCITV